MTTHTDRVTWQDLAHLPVADATQDRRDEALAPILAAAPARLDSPATWRKICGPQALRHALGISLAEMAKLLAIYTPHHYRRAAVNAWERVERGLPASRRYKPTPAVRAAFAQLVADVVRMAGRGDLRAQATIGVWRWHVELRRACRRCGREFAPGRVGQGQCARCVRKGKG